MKILTPYGIEQYARAKSAPGRALAWIKNHRWFCVAQTACLAATPAIIWLSEMSRGYRAYGSEMLIVVAPLLVKFGQWVLHYDDERDV